ncbi:dephospho-CoA kinase [Fundidesulfovibrio soli]|uniref:dephospho-CoA kinase n=1 Tax=Fundidesulfovibrio soli TaxID=2922716 RepID=UPI001FAFC656|nr:dephospho-CoA kinase [Fundidesulfovibrio soli]
MSGSILRHTAPGPGRLDQCWAEQLAEQSVTRAKIQKWIAAGLATVDGAVESKASRKLRGGEALELAAPALEDSPAAESSDISLVYRDEQLIVLNKPAGLTVHPAPSCPEGTLVNRLLHHFPELASIEGQRPGIVHRIDKDTSGLLAVALNEPVRLKLSEAFANREVNKTYLALLCGDPAKEQAEIDAPIWRDPSHKSRMGVVKGGREAHSAYRRVWADGKGRASLAEVSISTGRTHQIRVHMSHIGHPLLGDALYGASPSKQAARADRLLGKLAARQMLHAWKLAFDHPVTGERLDFTCPTPKDFWRIPLYLARSVQRVAIVGLPGGGKSEALKALARRGLPVWSADRCVAELYQPGADGWHLLRARYGERFVPDPAKPVDKKALMAAMRASDGLRREVMDALYPIIRHRLEDFWAENARARAAFAEIPMLLESGWLAQGEADLAVGVDTPDEQRHQRLAGRGWNEEDIALVDSWQWPRERKMAACAHVLDNSGSLAEMEAGVDALLAGLKAQRRDKSRSLLAWMRSNGYA